VLVSLRKLKKAKDYFAATTVCVETEQTKKET